MKVALFLATRTILARWWNFAGITDVWGFRPDSALGEKFGGSRDLNGGKSAPLGVPMHKRHRNDLPRLLEKHVRGPGLSDVDVHATY